MRGPDVPKAGTEGVPAWRSEGRLGGQVVEFPPQLRARGFQGGKLVVSPWDFDRVITVPFRM